MNEFGTALLYFILGLIFIGGGLVTTYLLAPSRPNPEKLSSYECGEEPVGTSWVQFNMRFYVMGLIFLIFDVELLLLFPFARIFGQADLIQQYHTWGIFVAVEAFVFVLVLLVGLVYIWQRGDIDWVRPNPLIPSTQARVPIQRYQTFNTEQAGIQPEPAPAITVDYSAAPEDGEASSASGK